jgi:ketosteroid isomerase-like protein
MSDQPVPEIELLRVAYAAFNARDIDAALALMTSDVAWPKAFKGGFVRGSEEVRAYWTEQWSEINPHVEPIFLLGGGRAHFGRCASGRA